MDWNRDHAQLSLVTIWLSHWKNGKVVETIAHSPGSLELGHHQGIVSWLIDAREKRKRVNYKNYISPTPQKQRGKKRKAAFKIILSLLLLWFPVFSFFSRFSYLRHEIFWIEQIGCISSRCIMMVGINLFMFGHVSVFRTRRTAVSHFENYPLLHKCGRVGMKLGRTLVKGNLFSLWRSQASYIPVPLGYLWPRVLSWTQNIFIWSRNKIDFVVSEADMSSR